MQWLYKMLSNEHSSDSIIEEYTQHSLMSQIVAILTLCAISVIICEVCRSASSTLALLILLQVMRKLSEQREELGDVLRHLYGLT